MPGGSASYVWGHMQQHVQTQHADIFALQVPVACKHTVACTKVHGSMHACPLTSLSMRICGDSLRESLPPVPPDPWVARAPGRRGGAMPSTADEAAAAAALDASPRVMHAKCMGACTAPGQELIDRLNRLGVCEGI